MRELEGRVAVVTGAGSGIGYSIARRLGREGARVAVNYYRTYEEEAHGLAEELTAAGARSIAVQADVSLSADVNRLERGVREELGPATILVNNAGIEAAAPFLELREEAWDTVLAVNLKGPFLCSQAFARTMREQGGGAIVNISSVHEDLPFLEQAAYAASKGGLRMLMRNLAVELAPNGIRVNNIAPGAIATPLNREEVADPEAVDVLRRTVPLRRFGQPDEVAEVALFLVSDRAAYVTGSSYYVDGGLVRHTEPV